MLLGIREVVRPEPGAYVRALAVFAVAVIAAACAGRPDERPTSSPSPTATGPRATPTPTGTALGQSCASPVDGYKIGYPEGWHVNNPEAAPACTWFHPEPFQLPQNTEATGIAISVRTEEGEFERIVQGTTEGPHIKELTERSSPSVAGKKAVRAQTVSSGEALFDEGTRQTTWVVPWDGKVLVASTTSAAAGEYPRNVSVLDGMMESLESYRSDAKCSAAALDPTLPDQEGLPGPVRDMRREIAVAAVECDFRKLAELARRGGGNFTYSFGDGGDPAAYWKRQEAEGLGPQPMRYLVGLLKRSHGTRQVSGATHYVWPAAFAFDSWKDVPEQKRQELEPLYTEQNFANFGQFGGYLGFRVGIDQLGNWLYFVAGD